MNETARDSIAATAITALKSIRAVTKVFKPSRIKPTVVQDKTLKQSFYTIGNKKIPCIRIVGSNQRYNGNERLRFSSMRLADSIAKVFRFDDKFSDDGSKYLIVASSSGEAKKIAKSIVAGKAAAYAGLAKRAVSKLMMKTNTNQKVNDAVTYLANKTAQEVTHKREVIAKAKDGNGGKYGLILVDELRYAFDAIKGGRAEVENAMKRALNKITHQINNKISKGDFLFARKLETPFPEVRKK